MKKSNKTPKNEMTDSGHETRILLEEIRQQVKTVAEGHGGILRKLEENTRKLEENTRKLGENTQILNDHGQHLDRIEIVLTDTNDRVKTIEKDYGARITKLEEKLTV